MDGGEPAKTSFDDVMALGPTAVFLSNGPGDPAATGNYAVPVIAKLLEADVPLFGICLGHQLLALAAGAKTIKMHQGHRGANHPVQRVGGGLGRDFGSGRDHEHEPRLCGGCGDLAGHG